MKRASLFLICPDCCIENPIQQHFKGESYFLTALGSVFNLSDENYLETITEFIKLHNIEEIIIVNDCSCRFIQSVICNEKGFQTKAEEILKIIHLSGVLEITSESHAYKKAYKLAELNIQHQAHAIKEIDALNNKIQKNEIRLKGLIYERASDSFFEVAV
ncbi:MAG TPA: carbonic anhydrase [Cytophagaceae bacterium]